MFSDELLLSILSLVIIANHITAALHLRALSYASITMSTPFRESGPMKHTTVSVCYEGFYQRLRHFRLNAGTDGCEGRVSGARQQLVENSGIRASDFSRCRFNLRQCSNETKVSISLV